MAWRNPDFQSPIIQSFKCKLIRFSAFHCVRCSLRNRCDRWYILSETVETRNTSGISTKHPTGRDFYGGIVTLYRVTRTIYIKCMRIGRISHLVYNKIHKCLQMPIKIRAIWGRRAIDDFYRRRTQRIDSCDLRVAF